MAKGRTVSITTKRRNQLTRNLVLQMMDKKEAGGAETPGLLSKMMAKLEQDLESDDEELRHKTMDKIIKLLPFVIAKEKAPAVQLNVQNNMSGSPHISSGKTTSLAISTMQDYLNGRNKQKKQKLLPQIEEAEIIEVDGSANTIIDRGPIEFEDEDGEEEEE